MKMAKAKKVKEVEKDAMDIVNDLDLGVFVERFLMDG